MTYETEARIREAFQEERDQLKAEIERLRDIIRGGNCIRDSDGKSECERLRRERDAARRDAERYRWLRPMMWLGGSDEHPCFLALPIDATLLGRVDKGTDLLDAAIDAARSVE